MIESIMLLLPTDIELSGAYMEECGSLQIAVNGLSLAVERGECFGLLGPNGAGGPRDQICSRAWHHALKSLQGHEPCSLLVACICEAVICLHYALHRIEKCSACNLLLQMQASFRAETR